MTMKKVMKIKQIVNNNSNNNNNNNIHETIKEF